MLRRFSKLMALGSEEQSMTEQTLKIFAYFSLSHQNAWDGAYGDVLVVEPCARRAFSPVNRHRHLCTVRCMWPSSTILSCGAQVTAD